jgi:hypothetical protein
MSPAFKPKKSAINHSTDHRSSLNSLRKLNSGKMSTSNDFAVSIEKTGQSTNTTTVGLMNVKRKGQVEHSTSRYHG